MLKIQSQDLAKEKVEIEFVENYVKIKELKKKEKVEKQKKVVTQKKEEVPAEDSSSETSSQS